VPDYKWLATEMKTGRVIADLPDLAGDNGSPLTVKQTMGRYEQLSCSLPLPTAPENWQRATLHGATTIVLLQDDVPVWGGYVFRRPRTAGDDVEMQLMGLEGYLDRRYVGDITFTAAGQNSIVQTLIANYVTAGSNGGIPLRVEIVNGGAGKLRDWTGYDKDDKTVYSKLQDMAGVIDGIEWTVGWEHLTNPERYTPVLYVGDRLGSAVPAGLAPAATFEMPGPLNDFLHMQDYGTSAGANDVMAYSSGEGTLRPQSPRQVAVDVDRPTFEHRFSPASSITVISTLTDHAKGKLAQMLGGATSLAMSAPASQAPMLGVDWFMGDDVGFQIGGLDAVGRDTVPGFPGGISGVARAVGWELELSDNPIVTPIVVGATL
jgi:hypothetical protein